MVKQGQTMSRFAEARQRPLPPAHCPPPTAHSPLPTPCRPLPPGRHGFTLLEVILTLLLTSLVLAALSMAISTQLRAVDRGRRHVEQAQLARALLQRIAGDVRSAVRYDPLDIKKLVPKLATQSLEDMAAQAGFGEMDFSDVEDEDASVAETTAPPPIPGIYGTRYELQVDVSRLPRIDQFQSSLVPTADGGSLLDRTSDVKTIAYYCVRPELTAVAQAVGGLMQTGLVRRELDRAVTSFAADQGMLGDMERGLEPIAPEVMAVEFEYFDGQEWLEEWDSDALGGLPVAIRVAIALDPRAPAAQTASAPGPFDAVATEEFEPVVYRMLVHLPASAPMQGSGGELLEEGTEEGTGQPQEAQQAASAKDASATGLSGSGDTSGASAGSFGGAAGRSGRFGGAGGGEGGRQGGRGGAAGAGGRGGGQRGRGGPGAGGSGRTPGARGGGFNPAGLPGSRGGGLNPGGSGGIPGLRGGLPGGAGLGSGGRGTGVNLGGLLGGQGGTSGGGASQGGGKQ